MVSIGKVKVCEQMLNQTKKTDRQTVKECGLVYTCDQMSEVKLLKLSLGIPQSCIRHKQTELVNRIGKTFN